MAWARDVLVAMQKKRNLGLIGSDFSIIHVAYLLLTRFGSSLSVKFNLRIMRNNKESNRVHIKKFLKN